MCLFALPSTIETGSQLCYAGEFFFKVNVKASVDLRFARLLLDLLNKNNPGLNIILITIIVN
jgi:hypothetical protein